MKPLMLLYIADRAASKAAGDRVEDRQAPSLFIEVVGLCPPFSLHITA